MTSDLFSTENSPKEQGQNDIKQKKEYKTLKIEDIRKACLEYFDGDGLASDVWINKYA